MKKSLVTLLLSLIVGLGFSQDYRHIKLKNGSEISGELIVENDQFIQVKTGDGNTWNFDRSEVLSIVTIKPVVSGFYNKINLGILGGSNASQSFHIINGYRFNRYWSAGFGMGIENFLNRGYIPLFFEGNFDILKGRTTPYLSGMAGYEMPFTGIKDLKGSFTAGGKVGFRFALGEHAAITTELGYRYVYFKNSANPWGWDDVFTISHLNRYEFRFGIVVH